MSISEGSEVMDIDKNPFKGMKIADWSMLEKVDERSICPKCNKSRKYFCYTCYIPVPSLQEIVPRLKLPVKIDIIKHAREVDGKSTAVHAAVIAPEDVSVYTYPCIPDYQNEENVVLVFPGKNCVSIQEYIDKHRNENEDDEAEPKCKRKYRSHAISKAVFIDSTWNQSRGIYKDQRLREIPCIILQSRISQFWRHQHGSPRWFLSTIEAVHQFLVEYHIVCKLTEQYVCTSGNAINQADHVEDKIRAMLNKSRDDEILQQNKTTAIDTDEKRVEKCNSALKPDKVPSKFVKNLALSRGIRVDSGSNQNENIKLLGPDQWIGKYGGQYDNLLFFFQFMYCKIHSIYDHSTLLSYQRRLE